MKKGFYPKLAASGIKNNKKTYMPYILTCVGMIMMFYIMSFLTHTDTVTAMFGGRQMQLILSFGCGVMGVFSLIFLFYTNSFLIRGRKKEFGLYNILGMGKQNIARVLIWESVIIASFSLVGGLICGILFSKLAELCMAHILDSEVSFTFHIEFTSVLYTLILFAVIFLLILLNALKQIHLSKPVELLHSDTVGEKPPKVNWLAALVGAVILGGAYYISVTIKEPMAAILLFFVAVIMVIVATYLLFIAGSVAICRLLQKNKRYYYKTNHFISVSSMVYRMKRNGAGLASICILSTMVLVTISSTTGLFIGTEDIIRTRYPRNIVIDVYSIKEEYSETIHNSVEEILDRRGVEQENVLHYRYLDIAGYVNGDQVIFDTSSLYTYQLSMYDDVRQLFIVPIEDYNRLMNESETLREDEVIIYSTRSEYTHDTITLEGGGTMRVKRTVPTFVDNGIDAMQIAGSLFIFVSDFESMESFFDIQAEIYGDNRINSYKHDYYGFDLNYENEKQIAVQEEISSAIQRISSEAQDEEDTFPLVTVEGVAKARDSFYGLYGGLFFLGIMLGLVFVFAAVLIMYYKQVSEGYEDKSRFGIMQKVGMTKKEIRKSINSQVLTVFFLPLLTAGVHMSFAFPIVFRLLTLFNLTNMKLLIIVTAACYLLFSLFYILVYRMTSRAYYNIVSGGKGDR